jgi:tetratricopeptide (TPR) repeat protein
MQSHYFKPFLSILCLLTIILSGCSLLPDDIKTAEKLLKSRPDSSLKILKNIHRINSLSNSDRALYGILMFQAMEKTSDKLGADSLINFSIEYYQRSKNKEKLALSLYYKAKLYKSVQQYENSADMYIRALDFLKESKNYELIAKIYSDLGYICNIQHDYDQAREKYELSARFFIKEGKSVEANYRLLNIGSTYRNEKKYKMALNNFHKVLSTTHDSMLFGAIYQEIGVTYYMSEKNDSARFYLAKSLLFPYKQDDYSIRSYAFADCWYKVEKLDSAMFYATKALQYPANFYTKRECYRLLANSSYVLGDFKGMANYMTHFQACSDSLRIIDLQTKTTVLESIHESKQAEGKSRNKFYSIAILLLILSTGGTFLYLKLRKRNKGNELNLQQKFEEIGQYQVQLTKKDNQLKTVLLQKMDDTRKLGAANYKKATLSEREKMDKAIYETCLHYKNWEEFRNLMNVTFNNIVDFLGKEYPQISKKEILLCCLYLCDLSSSDMALILEVQPTGVYKLKQRLATKMNLAGTKELNQLLDEKSVSK